MNTLIEKRLEQDRQLKGGETPGTVILLGFRGSIAHGMYVPNTDPNSIDDIDLMGIVVPDKARFFGLYDWGSSGTLSIQEDAWDIVLYEARKAIWLLAKANPNILSLLWLRPQDYLHKTLAGQLLLDHRDLFMTQALFPAFRGYAYSQLKKMKGGAFEGYMGAKRKRLVEQYGYDCKNAAHLIRLLQMGRDAALSGTLEVFRDNAEWLLEIKRGERSLEWVQKTAELLFEQFEEAERVTKLPKKPDLAAIDALCIEIVEKTL